MIKICISGLTGSGKNTLADTLAEELKIVHIKKEMTSAYAAMGKGKRDKVAEAKALTGFALARKFDEEITQLAAGKNCVVSTWLGPWFIKDATVRVWLDASPEERAKRYSRREGITQEAALKHIEEKDSITIANVKKGYGIDIMDYSIFDMRLNSERLSNDERTSVVAMVALSREEERFR